MEDRELLECLESNRNKVLTSKVLRFVTRLRNLWCLKSKKSTLATHQVPFPPPKPCCMVTQNSKRSSVYDRVLAPYWNWKMRHVGFLKCLELTLEVSPHYFVRKLEHGRLASSQGSPVRRCLFGFKKRYWTKTNMTEIMCCFRIGTS